MVASGLPMPNLVIQTYDYFLNAFALTEYIERFKKGDLKCYFKKSYRSRIKNTKNIGNKK